MTSLIIRAHLHLMQEGSVMNINHNFLRNYERCAVVVSTLIDLFNFDEQTMFELKSQLKELVLNGIEFGQDILTLFHDPWSWSCQQT